MSDKDKRSAESLEGLYQIRSGLVKQISDLQAADPVDQSAVGEAIKQLKVISDLIITEVWVSEIKDAITNNPSLALPPSVGQGSTARKLVNFRTQEDKRDKRDQRKSSTDPALKGTPWENYPSLGGRS